MADQEAPPWISSARAQGLIRTALAPSGLIGVKLVHWGFPDANMGELTEVILYLLPIIVAGAWSWWDKNQPRLIEAVAAILARNQTGTITINTRNAPSAISALATDKGSPANIIPKTGNADKDAIAVVAAMPDVTSVTVKSTATDGVAAAAADESLPKVVTLTSGSPAVDGKLG